MHWADSFAKQVVEKREKEEYVVESGITPSGVVHIGNFREVLTQFFVHKGILDLRKRSRFQYIWDDYDRFRKVPKGIPENFSQYIGMAVSKVPDPFGCHKSYAQHYCAVAEEEMKKLNILPEFFSATKLYEEGTFTEQIKTALEKTGQIKAILNKFRKEPLPEEWLPIHVYCEKCQKDTTHAKYLGEYKLSYKCECGFENEIDFREKKIVKLAWRTDWPARWAYYGVDFESSGKDHKSYGGSWDTGILISKEIFGYEPPVGPMYEHIFLKGQKEKMSSSKGNVATITQLFEIFEPEIIRWIYTQRINKAIFVPFDLDIYNIYNDFDKSERAYFNSDGDEELKRKYEFSKIRDFESCPNRLPFSELVLLSQVVPKLKLREHLQKLFSGRGLELTESDLDLGMERAEKAKNWVEKYAPEDVKIVLNQEKVEVSSEQKEGLRKILEVISESDSAEEIQKGISELAKEQGKELFQILYTILIGKKAGPRIGMLIESIGKDRAVERLKNIL